MPTSPEIEIVSDVICPWCYIGKKRLERALAERPEIPVSTSWRAFQLNPDMPPEGMERSAYLAAKFGGQGHAQRIYGAITAAGAAEGIPFAFDRIRRTPNTVDAHRLIRFASRSGRGGETVEALFRAYFTEGRDIGDRAVLADVAQETGFERGRRLGPSSFKRAAASSSERPFGEVRSSDRTAAMGTACQLVGEPFMVVSGVHGFSGSRLVGGAVDMDA